MGGIREQINALPEFIAFWFEGGIQLTEPIARADGETVFLSLLLQPDGDVVLKVPRGFGDAPEDVAATRALFERANALLRRMSRTGLGALASLAPAIIYASIAAMWIWALLPPWSWETLTPIMWSIASTVALLLLRTVGRPWLRRAAEALALRWIRRRFG